MQKLIIAVASPYLCDMLRRELADQFDIYCSCDGEDVLDLMCMIHPDLMILELALPGNDGISILQSANAAGIHPHVLVISDIITDYICNGLQGMHAFHLMRSPVSVPAVVNRLMDYSLQLSIDDRQALLLETTINSSLLSLGLERRLSGYKFIAAAGRLSFQAGRILSMKELYAQSSLLFDATETQIEKAIRDSVHKAWKHRNEAVWRMYFPQWKDGLIKCPSNSVFLAHFCHKLIANPVLHAQEREAK